VKLDISFLGLNRERFGKVLGKSLSILKQDGPLMNKKELDRIKMTGAISFLCLLSLSIVSITQSTYRLTFAQGEEKSMMNMTSSLPQPNGNGTLLKVEASNALFEPAVGLSNVYGPKGLFPFEDVFKCGNALTCGIPAGDDSKFTGTFEQKNLNKMTAYEATYTSPVTYGPHQIKGHTYKITLTDTEWNSPDAALPTKNAEFSQMVNNVGFNQIQHGSSQIDRSDVPQLYDSAFLYGHAKVTDITNGNNTVVAKDIFTHVMVAHVMDEKAYYRNMKNEAKSPNMVFLFAVNIPNDTELPGVGKLTAEKAQSFTPLSTDPSLKTTPKISYPVKMDEPREGQIDKPMSQSVIWPVANPKQPLFFTFLVYQNVDVKWTAGMKSGTGQ